MQKISIMHGEAFSLLPTQKSCCVHGTLIKVGEKVFSVMYLIKPNMKVYIMVYRHF